jgi:acetyltransferase-like isoleucine patch superfamily enzyme
MENLINILIHLRDLYLTRIKWRRFTFGKGFHAGRNVHLWAKHDISIGTNCHIGRYSQIECDAIIGNNVIIANQVALVGKYDHHYQQIGVPIRLASKIMDKDYNWKGLDLCVIIEDDVWIGYGSIILSGVKISIGSIIAAGSVVTRDVEAHSIYGGVPAIKIANRFDNEDLLSQHITIYNEKYKYNGLNLNCGFSNLHI